MLVGFRGLGFRVESLSEYRSRALEFCRLLTVSVDCTVADKLVLSLTPEELRSLHSPDAPPPLNLSALFHRGARSRGGFRKSGGSPGLRRAAVLYKLHRSQVERRVLSLA